MLDLRLTTYLAVVCLSSMTVFAATPGKQKQGQSQKRQTWRQQAIVKNQREATLELAGRADVEEELRSQYKITRMTVSDVTDKFLSQSSENQRDLQFSSRENLPGPDRSGIHSSDILSEDSANLKTNVAQKSSLAKETDFQPGVVSEWADEIINVGTKVWSIIEAGRPVSSQKMESANALPKGVEDWTELQGWSAPISRVYSVVYENGFGFSMIELTFRVTFNYGGNYHGHGKYIANAAVHIENLRIGFGGIKYDVQVDVPAVFNQGTTRDPIAGMQLNVKRVADTVFSRNENTDSFFLNGLGVLQKF